MKIDAGMTRTRALARVIAVLTTLTFALWVDTAWALVVGADIAVDTTWTLADSPVTVTDADFRVALGATLTIDPGVTVKFAGSVTVYGTLDAIGTDPDRITFDEVNPGDKWGILKFGRAACGDAHNQSTIAYVDMVNLDGYIYVDRQSLHIDNSSIDIQSAGRYGITSYNNNGAACPGPAAQFDFTNNGYSFTTTFTGGGLDSVEGIIIDGVNSSFSNNGITVITDGAPYDVYGIYMYTSNTDDFVSGVDNNLITVVANDDATAYAVGVKFEDGGIDAIAADNMINIAAPRAAYGLWLLGQDALRNRIMADSSYSGSVFQEPVFGIYSESTDSGTIVRDNVITLTSPDERRLTGIFCQAGTILGNRLILSLSGTSGSASGFWHQYYDAEIVNNSVRLSGPAGTEIYGAYFGTKYATTATTLKNNIFHGNGQADSFGVYVDDDYAGPVTNPYNLVYNFAAPYSGLSAGVGALSADPLFSNIAELTLLSTSPALDKGDWESDYSDEPSPNGGRIDIGGFGNSALSGVTTVNIAAPEITTNSGANFTVNAAAVTLEGSTSTSSDSVWVNGTTGGVSYTAGQVRWSYTGSLALGANAFSVLAKNGGGQSSAADTVQVTYADTTPPLVTAVFPADGATGVDIFTDLTAQFSEALDGMTLTSAAFTLSGGVGGDVTYDGTVATLTTGVSLAYSTAYTAMLTTGIEDAQGNAMATAFSWSFTTQADPHAGEGEEEDGPEEDPEEGGDESGEGDSEEDGGEALVESDGGATGSDDADGVSEAGIGGGSQESAPAVVSTGCSLVAGKAGPMGPNAWVSFWLGAFPFWAWARWRVRI